MAAFLTTDSTMMCPHGGTVTVTSANTRTKAGGAFVIGATDTFVIAGCAFSLSAEPHPCVQVEWIVTAMQSTAGGDATLTEESVGLCVAADGAPQGGVLIDSTQPSVAGL